MDAAGKTSQGSHKGPALCAFLQSEAAATARAQANRCALLLAERLCAPSRPSLRPHQRRPTRGDWLAGEWNGVEHSSPQSACSAGWRGAQACGWLSPYTAYGTCHRPCNLASGSRQLTPAVQIKGRGKRAIGRTADGDPGLVPVALAALTPSRPFHAIVEPALVAIPELQAGLPHRAIGCARLAKRTPRGGQGATDARQFWEPGHYQYGVQ